ncbi:ExbD/TolR family protein [Paludibacterium paludis]|uniref:Biopolymer transporter ExbD n=1 Tax=Paludibacterium paludis TaxID=1225769 RepID=A0A918U6Z5_9NEIS|nr:biopolymer transporter ExbD [Paludibacterium paludis]GGY02470.1 biopolymer transporter ExbD [Paludibacterium paludis]
MNFRRGRVRDEPEINFIPLIDVLLVILIFLMVTTSYSRFSELEVNLPAAAGKASEARPREIIVEVARDGRVKVAGAAMPAGDTGSLTSALKTAAQGKSDAVVTIDADAGATHQSVVSVMEAARNAGLSQLTFATRTPQQ